MSTKLYANIKRFFVNHKYCRDIHTTGTSKQTKNSYSTLYIFIFTNFAAQGIHQYNIFFVTKS